jgi:hypothetical protein
MKASSNSSPALNLKLPGGLVMRRALPADRASLLALNTEQLGLDSQVEVTFLLDGGLPGVGLEDFLVVVEPGGRVVSSLVLLEQELRVGRTLLRIGNPEFVSTLPEYRGRGLVRRQFEVLQGWQEDRGLAFSLIIGIPYFYRLFGYEYALEDYRAGFLYPGIHLDRLAGLPGLEIRRSRESDAPALAKIYAETAAQFDIALNFPVAGWAWAARVRRLDENLCEDWAALDGDRLVGSARLYRRGNTVTIFRFAGSLAAQQGLVRQALALPGLEKLSINAPPQGPLGQWATGLEAGRDPSYANYIKIIDPALAFEQLRFEFEDRLARSAMAGLSREVELGFYRFGLLLVFEAGKLVRVEPRPGQPDPKITIPPDLLPKLLLGFRSPDELARMFPDFMASAPEDWALLQILFPALTSKIGFFI